MRVYDNFILEMSKYIYKYLDYEQGDTKQWKALKSNAIGRNIDINKLVGYRSNTTLEKLKTPFQRRQELKSVKSAMEQMNTLSKEIGFKRKRARVINNEYQHGILGVDDPINQDSKIYHDK